MGTRKVKKRKLNEVDESPIQTSSKSAKTSHKMTVSGVKELKKRIKAHAGKSVKELEIKAVGQGNNTVQNFAIGLSEIRKLLPNLKSLSLDASAEREECEADVLREIFKTWNGSKSLESLSLHMDWVQFQDLDSVLTGFSPFDCIKLKMSLGTTKNIPTTGLKKNKYSLASLPGLKRLNIVMCEVKRIDRPDSPSFNKDKFEVIIFVLSRYLFNTMKQIRINIEYIGDDNSDDDECDVDDDEDSDEDDG